MLEIVKNDVAYRCNVCGMEYENRQDAIACENRPVEPPTFQVGDKVTALPYRRCHREPYKQFAMHGCVTAVGSPEAPDQDFEIRQLGGETKRLGSHVRTYEVSYRCPICRQMRDMIYYAPHLRLIERPAARKRR